jgi:RNA polymerase sigma factor (sigma-70 family)
LGELREMSENDDDYTKEEMWVILRALFDYPKEERRYSTDKKGRYLTDKNGKRLKEGGKYLTDKNGNRLPSPLEKMARNTIPSGTDHNALNYGPADLAQDTVMRCLAGHKSFKKGTNFEAWVKTVMVNRWIDLCRLRWPHLETKLPPVGGDDGEPKDPMEIFPDSGLTATQIYARQRCYEKLAPPTHKKVFKYFWQGFKQRQIAEKMNTNINTIATWLTAAKKDYRLCLDDQGAI